MTPAKVGQIAAFMGTHYASHARCEAACSRGHCLPYESPSGSKEFGCVIKCEVDKDCPPELACNCAQNKPPDCEDIVDFLEGTIHGFCLAREIDHVNDARR